VRTEARQPPGFVPADELSTWLVLGEDGLERRAWLFLPGDAPGPLPVVLCPHPFGLTALGNLFGETGGHRTLVDIPGITPAARRHGFAVLTLVAEGLRVTGGSLGLPTHLDAYVTALREASEAGAALDLDAVVAAGLSMGGQEAILLGCRHPDIVRAVAAQSPVTDLVAWHRHLTALPEGGAHAAAIRTELGASSDSAPEAWAERSPSSLAAPRLRLQVRLNRLDSLVPAWEQGLAYVRAVVEAGGNVEVVEDLPAMIDGRNPGRAAHEHVSWDAILQWLHTVLLQRRVA